MLHIQSWIPYPFANAYTIMLVVLAAIFVFIMASKFFISGTMWRRLTGLLSVAYWFFIVIAMTIIGRHPAGFSQAEWHLFWCVRAAWVNHDPINWYLIVGNILLFIPAGILLPVFFDKMRSCKKTVAFGLAVSVCIELVQYVFHRGLCELDDVFNNTLGCLLGYCLFVLGVSFVKKDIKKIEVICAAGIWIMIIGFFAAAQLMGQPVFAWLL